MRCVLPVVAALALAAGCKDKSPKQRPASNASVFTEDPRPFDGPRCAETGGRLLQRTVEIAVVAGAGVASEAIADVIDAAQRYYAGLGVKLVPAGGGIERIADRYLLGGTIDEVESAIEAEGIEAGELTAGSPRVRALVARTVAGPLIRLLEGRARPGPMIDVVVVERIASPRSPVQMLISEVAGLTLSPLLEPESHGSSELARTLAVKGQVATVLLSTRELSRLPPASRRTVAAHEIGHALGLPHRRDRTNLMSPERSRDCLPALNGDQLDRLERGIDALGHRNAE